jgi:hypothetical protein
MTAGKRNKGVCHTAEAKIIIAKTLGIGLLYKGCPPIQREIFYGTSGHRIVL